MLMHKNGTLKKAVNVDGGSSYVNTNPAMDLDGNGIPDTFGGGGVYLMGYERGGHTDKDGIRYANRDLSNYTGGWVGGTQAHSVGGTTYSTSSVTVLNRTITMSQTGCAEAWAYVSLGRMAGNASFSFDHSLSMGDQGAGDFQVHLVAGDDLADSE